MENENKKVAIYVGTSRESIKEARKAINNILRLHIGEEVKNKALDTLVKLSVSPSANLNNVKVKMK